MTRIGSLCTGYGGLDMAAETVTGGHTVWVSDIDKGACRILAHRYPHAPNIGDFTVIDWSTVEPIDVLCAGFPCQPLSKVGRRRGDKDERWIWDYVAGAVGALRPSIVVLENVRGLLTAGSGRLFGRVLGDLADRGYDAQWRCVRASDVGAPHERERVFVVATPADSDGISSGQPDRGVGSNPGSERPSWATDDRESRCGAALPAARATDTDFDSWRQYAPIVAAWGRAVGRPAPRVDADLTLITEWLMGLPAGWVTDVPGLSRSAQLKALGNGVVPQQAEYALRLMLAHTQDHALMEEIA